MKIAYHTYVFGGRSWLPAWTIEEALRLTAEAGFDGLELAACRPHGWPADLSPARRRELAQLAAAHGLAFSAVCLNQPNHNIASPLPEERRGALAYGGECVDLAADLECSLVVMGSGWSVQPYGPQDAWNWAAETLAALARRAEQRGVTLALENINSQRADVVVSSQDVARMVLETGSPALKPMLDIYHLHLEGEDPCEAVARLGKDLAYVHFLDARLAGRARLLPGQGELPLADILNALQNAGYDGWLGLEIWGGDPLAMGRQAMAFFTAHLKER